ncbi:MAG: AAA family ATPase [Pseudomonadota bacterium]
MNQIESTQIHPWNQQIWHSLTQDPERSPHALLLCGSPGLGKRYLAQAFAEYVLTDGNLHHQQLFYAGNHPDYYVIKPENLTHARMELESSFSDPALSNQYSTRLQIKHTGKPKQSITIEQIRKLSEMITTHAHLAPTKVIMIDHADLMNLNASNALLKNLEEPPSNTLFLLITDAIHRIASTVRSRCTLVEFNSPTVETGVSWLLDNQLGDQDEAIANLSMANNAPLLAASFIQQQYRQTLRSILQSVNGIWQDQLSVCDAAKQWQEVGATQAVDLLHKLIADLIRAQNTSESYQSFFPVQADWVRKISSKLSKQRLYAINEHFVDVKKMILTSVDTLLVLESLGIQFRHLAQNDQVM